MPRRRNADRTPKKKEPAPQPCLAGRSGDLAMPAQTTRAYAPLGDADEEQGPGAASGPSHSRENLAMAAQQTTGAYAALDASVEVDGPATRSLAESGARANRATKRPRCLCCRQCLFELREWFAKTEVRGVRLPHLIGSLVLPVSDAWLDWGVIIEWYLQGDVHWAEVGLVILLVSGTLSGLGLVSMFGKNVPGPGVGVVPLCLGVTGLAPMGALVLHTKDAYEGRILLRRTVRPRRPSSITSWWS